MDSSTELSRLLKALEPTLNSGEYVFCAIDDEAILNRKEVLMLFREKEMVTVIVRREVADKYKLTYSFIASWITLQVHSELDAVGLTAAFSAELTAAGISCNVVAAFYHDHLFVHVKDAEKAMQVLTSLQKRNVQ